MVIADHDLDGFHLRLLGGLSVALLDRGQQSANAGPAGGVGGDGHRSSDFGGSFPHRGEAESRVVIGRYAASVVRHFNGESVRLLPDCDDAVLRPGVAGDVVQCLQGDAVGGDLDGCWQRLECAWGVDSNGQVGRLVDVGSDCFDEPERVQGRRAELVGDPADVVHGGVSLIQHPGEQRGGAVRVGGYEVPGRLDLHGHARQLWSQAIV